MIELIANRPAQAMQKRDNEPLYDIGETGIHNMDDIHSDEFISRYRTGRRLVALLTVAMVVALGLSIQAAIQTNPLADIRKNEKNIEGNDINKLSQCLPSCQLEDIYRLESITVPFIAAKEIMLPYTSNLIGHKSGSLLWEGDELHQEVAAIFIEKYESIEDGLIDGEVYQQNMIYMASHLLSRAEENAIKRMEAVRESCVSGLILGTCRKSANSILNTLGSVKEAAIEANNKMADLLRKAEDN